MEVDMTKSQNTLGHANIHKKKRTPQERRQEPPPNLEANLG
jgi:hypothetical protein